MLSIVVYNKCSMHVTLYTSLRIMLVTSMLHACYMHMISMYHESVKLVNARDIEVPLSKYHNCGMPVACMQQAWKISQIHACYMKHACSNP